MKPNKTNALIFDLDGTLWDASDAVAESFNVKLSQLGLPERITGDMMRSQMGKTLEEIAVVFFSNYDRDKAVEIMRACTDYENEYIKSHGGRLYPGVREMLEGVRKKRLVLCLRFKLPVGVYRGIYQLPSARWTV